MKVADFGLVKELAHKNADGTALTQDDAILGSPQYMSPEQCRSQPVDSRSDIYSLGATYYSMLTGRPPYESTIPMMLMLQHCSSPSPDPRQLVPGIPETCVEILQLAMQKEPDERFSTAAEMRAALESALVGVAKGAYSFLLPTSVPRQPIRQRRSDELRAALEEENGDGMTLSTSSPGTGAATRRPKELESSEERRMAMLEAALAMAPTAPIFRPSKAQVWRWRYGRALLATTALLAALVATIVGRQFGRLLGEEPVAKAAVRSPLKVGIIHSLSGPLSPVARPVVDATLLAIDEINEQGGLLGRSIEAVVVDGKSDTESFAAATERLLAHDKIEVIFGGLHTSGRRGIGQVIKAREQLLLYPGDAEGLDDAANTFYFGGVPAQRIEPALRYSAKTLGYKRFFLLGSDLSCARGLSAILHDGISELGGKVVGERLVASGAPDFGGAIKKIASAEPELVVSTLRGDANVYFFRAWQKRDKRLRDLPVLSLALDENILTLLDDTDLAQNYLAGSYFQAVESPENADFIRRFRRKYGLHHVVTEAMEAAYASVYLWAQAVRAGGDLQTGALRGLLRAQTLQAPSALYRFEPSSNYAWKAFHLMRIGAGNKLELVESAPALIRPQVFPASRPRAQWEALCGRM